MKKIMKVLCMAIMITTIVATNVAASGYRADFEIFVDPVYDDVFMFDEDFAPVCQNGKWGYINLNGDMVIEPQYDYACCFSEGMALVGYLETVTTSWGEEETVTLGIVNTNGEYSALMVPSDEGGMEQLVVDTLNYRCDDGTLRKFQYHNGFLVVPNGLSLCADTYAPQIIFDKNGEWFDNSISYTDINGMSDDLYMGGVYSDGLFYSAQTLGVDTPNALYVTKEGEIVAAYPRWTHMANGGYVVDEAYEFCNGYAGAWGRDVNTYESLFMLINKQGEILFARDYQRVQYLYIAGEDGMRVVNDGIVAVMDKNDKWGAVNVNGDVVVPFIYDEMHPSTEGLIAVAKDGKWGYVDGDGNEVIALQYDEATMFDNGIALVKKDGIPAIIDRYNNVLEGGENVPLKNYIRDDGSVWSISDIIIVEENGKYGFSKLTYNIGLPAEEEMSAWAYPEVIEAIENNLVPMYLRNNYFDSITREDFAQLIVCALEEVTGKKAEKLLIENAGITMAQAYRTNPFEDTADKNVIIANKLGIINGVSEVLFAPDNKIIRQDAATLLMRAAKLISGNVEITEKTFADDENIADYAKQAVSYVTTLKIMNGVGDDRFDPVSTYTREQAYVTIVRLFESLQN